MTIDPDDVLAQVREANGTAAVNAEIARREVETARARLGLAVEFAIVAAEDEGRADGLLATTAREHAAWTCDPERDLAQLALAAEGAVVITDASRQSLQNVRGALAGSLVD